jgi:argininosuccinate synthase
MGQFVTTIDELVAQPPQKLLLLYSGGVDGTYLLQWARRNQIPVVSLSVRIGEAGETDARTRAEAFGIEHHQVDATAAFYEDFVPAAIHADAYYQGLFPVGSTLSRPLMAKCAVELASKLGCDAVGHTATYMQNSAVRLSSALISLQPDLSVVAPFLGSDVPRQEKLASLASDGMRFTRGIHSVDANPWSRVIECGTLEDPENPIPEEVFCWTRPVNETPVAAVELDLAFRHGLPVGLDGQPMALADLVPLLNDLAGIHGVGRFSGLEDTPFGVKNHEVRESPAAAVITAAHRVLANAVLSTREHAVRSQLATEWTNEVVHGGWFGTLGRSLSGALASLDEPVTGHVRLRLHRGNVQTVAVRADAGLYYTRLGEEFHDWMRQQAYQPWMALRTLSERHRRQIPATAVASSGEIR